MKWIWQNKKWPDFKYRKGDIEHLEGQFLLDSGMLLGAFTHLDAGNRNNLTVDFLSEEALCSSEIEGEILDRDSVRDSLKKNFGINPGSKGALPKESRVAEMMVDAYKTFDQALTNDQLCRWHELLKSGDRSIHNIGKYRTHPEDMEVISEPSFGRRIVHYVAVPSDRVPDEMNQFIDWFNRTAPAGPDRLPPLERAAVAHLYFVAIHPFEDGNGRIARALSEKALSQSLGQPAMIALSQTIKSEKEEYYKSLEVTRGGGLDIDRWVKYFAGASIRAIGTSSDLTRFIIEKTKMYDRVRDKMNVRQAKVVECMLKKGLAGWEGGMSSRKYEKIAKTSEATARRDLQSLVEMEVFVRTGDARATRYWIPFQPGKPADGIE